MQALPGTQVIPLPEDTAVFAGFGVPTKGLPWGILVVVHARGLWPFGERELGLRTCCLRVLGSLAGVQVRFSACGFGLKGWSRLRPEGLHRFVA